jgi:hypothetical protein
MFEGGALGFGRRVDVGGRAPCGAGAFRYVANDVDIQASPILVEPMKLRVDMDWAKKYSPTVRLFINHRAATRRSPPNNRCSELTVYNMTPQALGRG